MRQKNSAAPAWLGVGLFAVLLVVGLLWLLGGFGPSGPTAPERGGPAAAGQHGPVPDRVQRTLDLIDAGQWPEAANAPGTRGGRTFRNNEALLPRTDSTGARASYREWDVNPKRPGRSRDAERIITGADGSAWYTLDHYRSFHRIRGPEQRGNPR
ncbi:putative guanyl-specific ribonuclease [Gordonia araii NBRC 100433]|uniref:Putative guanyl-specific ribonuclease n=1 Tax=Gordonia araii NBRC 100433 TaxID=1073574 RepID=G7GXZ0_9ACTN|nr:ribonuclease domain-containing protein [Gordonia araii]NNG98077.1 guanine-specific ribonuclease N1 and T1 [Gordonia araii NBRC 100433]GAB08465.1 putative guanyl-specific ribonuclease [Gordonia araii NBRC 100433]